MSFTAQFYVVVCIYTIGNDRRLLRLVSLSTVFVAAVYSSTTAVVDAADSASYVMVKTLSLSFTIIFAISF